MGSTRYERGREAEYKVQRLYEGRGWDARRTAGSHGTYDVIAIGPKEVHLIQVKSEQATSYGYDAEAKKLLDLPTPHQVRKFFFVWRKGKGWIQRFEITTHRKSKPPTWLIPRVSELEKGGTPTSSI